MSGSGPRSGRSSRRTGARPCPAGGRDRGHGAGADRRRRLLRRHRQARGRPVPRRSTSAWSWRSRCRRPVAAQWRDGSCSTGGRCPAPTAGCSPRATVLTVGVIAARGQGSATRQYLSDFTGRLGSAGIPPPGTPVTSPTAGPTTRRCAGGACRRGGRGGPARALDPGRDQLRAPFRDAGRDGRRVYGRHPGSRAPGPGAGRLPGCSRRRRWCPRWTPGAAC